MTTATKSYTVLELLGSNIPEGTKAKVSTDNDLYGMTVVKKDGSLLNDRTGESLLLTGELLKSKFRLVKTEKRVALPEFLAAYKEGKKLKVVVGDKQRFLQKEELTGLIADEITSLLNAITNPAFAAQALSINDMLTMEELIEGEFYIC